LSGLIKTRNLLFPDHGLLYSAKEGAMQQMVHAGQVVEGYYKPGKGIGFNNSAFLTEMGYTVHQFAENPALALEILHPDDRDCFIRQLKESFIRHRAYSGEVRYLQGSGKTGRAYLVVNEQTDPEDTPILYHFRFIDITGLSAYGRPPENDPGYYLRLLDYQEDLNAISLPTQRSCMLTKPMPLFTAARLIWSLVSNGLIISRFRM